MQDTNNIIQQLKKNGQFEAAVEEINSWHSDCEEGNNGECAIYDAIQDGKSAEEIVLIAHDVDTELVERFLENTNGL